MKHLLPLGAVVIALTGCVPVHTYCPEGSCKAPAAVTPAPVMLTAPAPVIVPAQPMQPFTLHGVNFHLNSSRLTPEATHTLNKVLAYANKYPKTKFLVNGYCSKLGSFAYNQKLSVARASSVKTWLVANGVSASRLSVHGYSYLDPVATNATRAGRYLNQRVEIVPVK